MTRDRIAQPSAGRRFPLGLHDVVRLVEDLGFAVQFSDRRLPIIMENCRAETDRGRQLCSLHRRNYLAVFSLPEEVNPVLAGRALARALEVLAQIDRGPRLTTNEQQFVIYRAFLGSLGEVSVTEHIVNGVSRSYLKFRQASQLPRANHSTRGQREVAKLSVA